MEALLKISVVFSLLELTRSPCFAMVDIAQVSKADAKALGIEVRSQPNGPNETWIELEFKPWAS
jgi:hypothetical protein